MIAWYEYIGLCPYSPRFEPCLLAGQPQRRLYGHTLPLVTMAYHLRAGLLKTLGANKNTPLPVRLFEISDVILLSDRAETGARNERRLAAAVCAKENTFETIHGFLNRVMDVLGVPAHVPGLGETPARHAMHYSRSPSTTSFLVHRPVPCSVGAMLTP